MMHRPAISLRTGGSHWPGLILLGALLCAALGACSPGHIGGNEIGFLRGGALWAIDPDGSNLHQVAGGKIIGFSWSPDHQQIVLRMSNGGVLAAPVPFGFGDLNSELGVTSIDGGNIIQITPPNSGLLRSDAWWDTSSNRLLYREEQAGANDSPNTPRWKLSQDDQPAGIARKDLPASAVLPAVNSDGSLVASIDASGQVMVGPPGGATQIVATGALTILPGAPTYPARPLWQPGNGALLYAVASAGPTPDITTLVLRASSGAVLPLLTVANLQQYAWSPDGHMLLVRTASDYRLYSSTGSERLAWSDSSASSLPFWSPDSRFLVVLEPEQVTLVNVAARHIIPLLQGTFALPPAPSGAQIAPFLRPATNNPWNADSSAFLFSSDAQSIWSPEPDRALPTGNGSGNGLYLATLNSSGGAPQFPSLLDWGEHQSVAWTTLDPNCAFLMV